MESYFLGIDIGTGSTKAVALDASGRSLGMAQVSYPTLVPERGYSEQDPEIIWEAFVKCFREITARMGGRLQAVSFSSAMHSLLPVDESGRPLLNLMTWADSRAAQIAQQLRDSPDGEPLYRLTGTPVYSISLVPKILWIRENMPGVFSRTCKLISIKEFIWFKLFNAYQIDHSLASATGLFNIRDLEWEPLSLRLAGIDSTKLSEPVSTGALRYDLTDDSRKVLGLKEGTAFVIGGSDGCLANLGTFALGKGRAAITIGTSGAVRIGSTIPIFNYQAMTFNYRLDDETYICGGPINNGGLALDWLIKNFLNKGRITEGDYTNLFERIAGVVPGSEGLIFLPYLVGERAPAWDTRATGTFFGVTSAHTQDHFCRAVLEGVCFALKEVLEIVEVNEHPIEQIQVSGGFTGSLLWMQMLADITQKKVCIVHTEDASAIGAVHLALKALNFIPDYAALEHPKGNMMMPTEHSSIYQRNFNIYKRLYPNLKELMHL
ncbi:MAG TPA: gluconokinase [Sphingobacteriaceae bacterium]